MKTIVGFNYLCEMLKWLFELKESFSTENQ